MVTAPELGLDVLATTIAVATGPLLWLFLYLFGYEDPETARSAGFGRTTLWLLLPGALFGSVVNVPFFGWSGDLLAVNLGGGVLPLLVSLFVLRRSFGDADRFTALLLVAFASASGAQLVLLYLLPGGTTLELALAGVAAVVTIGLVLGGLRAHEPMRTTARSVAIVLAFAEMAVLATFLTTQTVPSVGIVSEFPEYLLAPLLLGALAGAIVPLLSRRGERSGLATAYGSLTLGVLVGADLLREPPLYAPNSSALYAIGGAGTADLLYLSGLLALVASYAVVRVVRRSEGRAPSVAPPTGSPTSGQLLRRSLLDAVRLRPVESVRGADAAVTEAVAQGRALLDLPSTATAESDLDGLGLPAWIVADRKNLHTLAQVGSPEPSIATRAWMTARWLVGIARGLGRPRFGSREARSMAFLVDLVIVLLPAAVGWYLLFRAVPGTLREVLTSVPANASWFGFVAYALVLFVVTEWAWGQTPGKRLLGLRVTDRRLRAPAALAVLLRNLPKAVTLTVVGYIVLLMSLVAERGSSLSIAAGGIVRIVATLASLGAALVPAVGVPGAVSFFVIGATPERQRFGDLLAGTWVVRVRTATAAVPGAAPGAAPSG